MDKRTMDRLKTEIFQSEVLLNWGIFKTLPDHKQRLFLNSLLSPHRIVLEIFNCIQQGLVTYKEIADYLKLNYVTIQNYCGLLYDEGFLVKVEREEKYNHKPRINLKLAEDLS